MRVMTAVTCMPDVVVHQVLDNLVRLSAFRVRSHEHVGRCAQGRNRHEHCKYECEPTATEG